MIYRNLRPNKFTFFCNLAKVPFLNLFLLNMDFYTFLVKID